MAYGTNLWLDDEENLVFDFEAILPSLHESTPVILVDEDGKKDFKRGTVVCRHWLRGLCMKGDNCEFLHQYDMSKMPECRWGMECQVPECPFRHVPDEDRMECAFYKQGFCSHGAACRYRHVKLSREECPVIADFGLQSKVAEEESAKRRKAQPVNEFFKIAICKHWEKQGSCPFGDECHFAHGDKELRPFPKDGHGGPGGGGNHHMGGGSHQMMPPPPHVIPFKAPDVPPSFVMPDAEGSSTYIVLRSHSYQNLAQSVHHQKFAAAGSTLQLIQDAMTMADQVFLFLSVSPSFHFQGVARIVQVPTGDDAGVSLADSTVPFAEWRGDFGVEWLRTCEIPFESADTIPTAKDAALSRLPDGTELTKECGHALLEKMFFHPMIRLHIKSVEDEGVLPGGAFELANRRRHAAESVANFVDPARLMPSAHVAHRWQVDLPGYVFACNGATIDESFGRMLFGLAKDQEQVAVKNVQVGTPLFLLNMSDRHVLGMFEATSSVGMNIIPNAFTAGMPPGTTATPFPVQVRFRFVFDAPPMLNDLLKSVPGLERGVRIGPLTLEATQTLANVFAERCKATNLNQDGAKVEKKANEEQFIVGIEEDKEFGVVQKILGPQGGSHVKRIILDAGGNAKVRLRGRGSGFIEANGEEAKDPLMLVVSADNDRSFRIACDASRDLLGSVVREWERFGYTDDSNETAADVTKPRDSITLDGVARPLTDALLVHLKEKCLAELEDRAPPPPFFLDDSPLGQEQTKLLPSVPEIPLELPDNSPITMGSSGGQQGDDVIAEKTQATATTPRFQDDNQATTTSNNSDIEDSDSDDIEASVLETFGDIQLATRVSSSSHASPRPPSPTSSSMCYCCHLTDTDHALGDVVPGMLAPVTRQIGCDLRIPPAIAQQVTSLCTWTSPLSAPFEFDVDEHGQLVVGQSVADTCLLNQGDVVLALNSTVVLETQQEDFDDPATFVSYADTFMASLPRPLIVLTANPTATVDSRQFHTFQLPSSENEEEEAVKCPHVSMVSDTLCQVMYPATGFAAVTGYIYPYDIIHAINGIRITSVDQVHALWQPRALVCIFRHPLDRGEEYATRLLSNGAPSDVRASVWRPKSYAMTFHDGPLGLALELDAHLVVVRSLTAVSQATHTVQSGDIILAINETPVGRLNDLTEFTDTVRSLSRPVSFRFYRPSLPLTTSSTTTKNAIRVTVGDILVAATWLECDKGLVVLSCSSSRVFQVGDTLTHINGVAVVGMTRAWLHDTLGVLPLYDQLLVVVRPPPVPDVPVQVHPQCAATWNQAMIRGTALRQKWTAATALETFLKSIAAVVASEESDAVATALHFAFQSRPPTPSLGPFSMRPHFTVTPSNQHESFVMLHGRQYFLGTFASASDAQTAYDQCQQRYDTRQLLLAPYSTTTFPRVALPSFKAEDVLKRLHVRRGPSCTSSSHHPLSAEMKYLVRYNIRAHRPKPSPPPTLTSNNEFVNHQGQQLQQQYHGASTKKRPLPDADTASSPYPITTTRTTSTNTSLEAHFKSLQELKTSIKQAWGSVQTSQNAQSCAHLSDALQSTHHTLTYVAQHLAKHPLDVATPLTFVGVHHASVLCLLTKSMSESLAKTSQMTLADLQLMHMCGDNLLWSIEACVTPSLHHQVMSYCVELASKLPTMLASGLLSAQIKATALTMDSFFNSSKYLAEPASSSVSCRPLFAMLNNHHTATATNHDHHSHQPHQHSAIIQPLPPSLTQELWKLHTCQAGPLGIIIQQEDNNNVITVASFAAGDQGQALRSGKVAVGDVIVAVNGDPISTIGIAGFKRAVSSGVRPLLITFRRRTQGEFATDSLPVSKATTSSSLAFSLVQAQLLAIEAALPRDAFRHNKWTPALRTGWADLIVHATSSRALLEALLVLEATIENEYLDPAFKAQSSLTIKMLLPTATIASAAMRLYALDDALSYVKSTLGELGGLTRLPSLILERWYKQCLALLPATSIFQRLMEEYVVLAPAGTLPEDLICDDACRVCRAEAQEHVMLLCDSCDAAYHSLCAGLDEVPTANWYCTRCVENPELK
ncbi:hypothetical protein B5M09_005607 [Aphanomyces astaci]|uniref:Uncharacterized protein n=1 Tax=Aphanomyces astaci TaxID=112090 RepID=A0A425D9Z7_APHAT|nr:hypothetical protein B5M09_005607 [Aphanomyces astaci]